MADRKTGWIKEQIKMFIGMKNEGVWDERMKECGMINEEVWDEE